MISPDGKQALTTANGDTSARLWDVVTGDLVATFDQTANEKQLNLRTSKVDDAIFSPDGRYVLTSSDGYISLWESGSGKRLRRIEFENKYFNARVKFSPSAELILTFDPNSSRKIQLWKVKTGELVTTLKTEAKNIYDVSFTPDGKHVLAALGDRTARLFDAATGEETTVFRGHDGVVYAAAVSPDTERLVTTGRDGTARLWVMPPRNDTIANFEEHMIQFAADLPGGPRVLFRMPGRTPRVLDTLTGKQLAELTWVADEKSIDAAAFSPDGKRVLIRMKRDSVVYIGNTMTGQLTASLVGHEKGIRSAEFSSDSQNVLTGVP